MTLENPSENVTSEVPKGVLSSVGHEQEHVVHQHEGLGPFGRKLPEIKKGEWSTSLFNCCYNPICCIASVLFGGLFVPIIFSEAMTMQNKNKNSCIECIKSLLKSIFFPKKSIKKKGKNETS